MYFTVFIFGVLSASFALFLELIILNVGPIFDYTTSAITFSGVLLLIAVALIEELCKFIFLHQYFVHFQKELFLNLVSSLALGLSFGAGFATLEIAFASADPMTLMVSLPLLGILLIHITTSLIITATLTRQNATRRFTAFALLIAISIHFLYNVLLSFVF